MLTEKRVVNQSFPSPQWQLVSDRMVGFKYGDTEGPQVDRSACPTRRLIQLEQ